LINSIYCSLRDFFQRIVVDVRAALKQIEKWIGHLISQESDLIRQYIERLRNEHLGKKVASLGFSPSSSSTAVIYTETEKQLREIGMQTIGKMRLKQVDMSFNIGSKPIYQPLPVFEKTETFSAELLAKFCQDSSSLNGGGTLSLNLLLQSFALAFKKTKRRDESLVPYALAQKNFHDVAKKVSFCEALPGGSALVPFLMFNRRVKKNALDLVLNAYCTFQEELPEETVSSKAPPPIKEENNQEANAEEAAPPVAGAEEPIEPPPPIAEQEPKAPLHNPMNPFLELDENDFVSKLQLFEIDSADSTDEDSLVTLNRLLFRILTEQMQFSGGAMLGSAAVGSSSSTTESVAISQEMHLSPFAAGPVFLFSPDS